MNECHVALQRRVLSDSEQYDSEIKDAKKKDGKVFDLMT